MIPIRTQIQLVFELLGVLTSYYNKYYYNLPYTTVIFHKMVFGRCHLIDICVKKGWSVESEQPCSTVLGRSKCLKIELIREVTRRPTVTITIIYRKLSYDIGISCLSYRE